MYNSRITGKLFLIIFLITLLLSCKREVKKAVPGPFRQGNSAEVPVVVEAGKPTVYSLESQPAPVKVRLSSRQAPEARPFDFFINMPEFNTEHGLAMSSILCGFEDSAGNLWFGTSGNGLSKYDGQAFTNYTSNHGLIHNLVNCIHEDESGNIWFGTYGGLSKYDGMGFQNFTMEHGLIDNDINGILADSDGNLWFSSTKGVTKLLKQDIDHAGSRFINYSEKDGLPGSFVGDLFIDSKGKLWLATDYGIALYNPESAAAGEKAFVNYPLLTGGVKVFTIVEDKSGFLWIGTDKGVVKVEPSGLVKGNEDFIRYTTSDGLINNEIKSSLVDRQGNVWFGTKTGLSEYRAEDSVFVNYTVKQGLAHNKVYSITRDHAGRLWFGTLGGGLSRYDGSSVTGIGGDDDFLLEAILAVSEDDDGNLWLCAGNGVFSFNVNNQGEKKKYFLRYNSSQGFPDNYPFAIIRDKTGRLWFSADRGLSSFDGETIVNYTVDQGLIDDNVVSLQEDSKGRLWIGTYEKGFSVFDGSTFRNFTTEQGLLHNTVWYFYEDEKGNMWMATRGGLSVFNGKTFINFTKAQGLRDNKLSYVTEDKNGNILIGSWGGGVSIIRKNTAEQLTSGNPTQVEGTVFEQFTTSEGLANDVVYGIIEDKDGNIFIGTSNGFTVLKGGIGPQGINIAGNGIEYFNQKTGYPIRDISNNFSMFLDSKGIIWAGTGDKLVRFDYSSVIRSTGPMKTRIQSVKVNHEHFSWNTLLYAGMDDSVRNREEYAVPAFLADELHVFGRLLTDEERDTLVKKYSDIGFDGIRPFSGIPENLVLPFKFNNISFDFNSPETARPFMVKYQYMLEGYDETWNPVTGKSTASFGNIPPGSYTFKVKALSPEGEWSGPALYKFEILPPFYRSWWAYLFYFLLLAAGIFAVDRFQRKRLIARERQRAVNLELMQAREIEKAYDELKSTQAQLIHSEKMASLGELAAGIAHEIQNPLNFVNNFSEVSKELIGEIQAELTNGNQEQASGMLKDVEANLDKINHHGKRADSIIKGMLQHSRSSAGTKEPANLNALADEYFRLAYHGLRAKDKSFNAAMETDYDPEIGLISFIPQDIGRVILNLITNAFYAVNEKRKLDQPGYKPVVKLQTRKILNGVEVNVTDNGDGIPDNIKDKIFQPFFTTKPTGQGTGLGLSMSFDIVTKGHGGELKVATAEGRGTTFTIFIPT